MAGERVQFMRAEIVAIGSELVSGQGLDTNSQWLSRALEAHGIPVAFHTTIGDQLDDHVSTFRIAAGRAELVIMTGGLGPTQDDLTREALAGRDPECRDMVVELIANGRVESHRNAMRFQRAAQPLAVGIEPLTADELAADRDDFGSHELHALPGHSLQPGGSPISAALTLPL